VEKRLTVRKARNERKRRTCQGGERHCGGAKRAHHQRAQSLEKTAVINTMRVVSSGKKKMKEERR